MEVKFTPVRTSNVSAVDFNNLEFGRVFTDYMLVSAFNGTEWSTPSIEPLRPLSIHPGAAMLHYGQTVFEGLKAYKTNDGRVNLFRLRDNLSRLNRSAERMAMAQIDEEVMYQAIVKYIELQRDWIPQRDQGSLYIRPYILATDDTLRAKPSEGYKFIVIACPVGFYYSKPLSIGVETKYSRAANGGVGFAKAGGNYGASFYPSMKAVNSGFDQILWTDRSNGNSIEELGSANFFFMTHDTLYTPKLKDSILQGITRDTVLTIARDMGIKVEETTISSAWFEEMLKREEVQCMFATGTAAALTFVHNISFEDRSYTVSSDLFEPVLSIRDEIDRIKFLESDNYPQWNVVV